MPDWSRPALFETLSELSEPQFERLLFILNPPSGDIPSSAASQGSRVSALLRWVESLTGRGLDHLQEVFAQEILYPSLSNEELELVDSLSGIPANDFEILIVQSQISSNEICWSSQVSQRVKATFFLVWARGAGGRGISFIRRTLNSISKNKTLSDSNNLEKHNKLSFDNEWKFDDKIPGCVSLKLFRKFHKVDAVENKIISERLKRKSADLFLFARFGEDEVNGPFGTILSFGIRKGILKLKLENCHIPSDEMRMAGERFYTYVPFKDEISERPFCTVILGGLETEPEWKFESCASTILPTLIDKNELARILFDGKNCRINANFYVSKKDLFFTKKEAIFIPHEHMQRNIPLVERAFLMRYLLRKLDPYLDHPDYNISNFAYEENMK